MDETENKQEVLSQSEVDALLSSVAEETTQSGGKAFQPYNFHTPSFLTAGKLRRVRIKHEEFASGITALISQFLKSEFSVRLSNLETVSHKSLVDILSGPTYLSLFRIEPLPGLALMEISPHLGLTVVSRMLGGKAQPVKEDRNFTDLELTVMTEFVETVLREYSSNWQSHNQVLKPALLGHETSARYLKLSNDSASVFLLTLEVNFGGCLGLMRLAFLHSTLEPLITKLADEISMDGTALATVKPPPVPLNTHIQESMADLAIPIRARWNGLQITTRDLCNLRKDDIILLDSAISSRTAIFLGTIHKFFGQIGSKGDTLAVRLSAKIQG